MRFRIPVLRVVAGVLGTGVLASGMALVITTDNSAASVTLATVGAVALATAVFSDRIETLEFGGAKLTLRSLARERTALAIESERSGHPLEAANLRKQAKALQRLAGAYERTRESMKVSGQRTQAMDDILRQAAELARNAQLSAVEVWTWFDSGDTEARAIVLGLMEGDPDLRDIHCVLEAIEHPRNLFEQYHGLVVAGQMHDELMGLERKWLREALEQVRRSKRSIEDAPIDSLSKHLIARLSSGAPNIPTT